MKTKGIVIVIAIVLLLTSFAIYNRLEVDRKEEREKEAATKQVNQNGYVGKTLAGKNALYLEFEQEDFEKAKQDGKIILLNFYATWCPICRAEEPDILSGFDSLTSDRVIGFRVNYNDDKTSEDEKNLARLYQITYQHTKVVLKNDKVELKETASWTKGVLVDKVTSRL